MIHHPGSFIKVNILQIQGHSLPLLKWIINVLNEIILQLEDQVCIVEKCDVYSNNKYETINDKFLWINLRLLINKKNKIKNDSKVKLNN